MELAHGSDVVEELRQADERVRELRTELEDGDIPLEAIESLVDAYRSVTAVLDRWEERATDWDDFQGYVEFRNDLAETLESIPEGLPHRDAFTKADSQVKTGGVSSALDTSDFDAARASLAQVEAIVDTYESLEDALDTRDEMYRRTRARADELRDRIESLERLLELGEADLDAPIERLRAPISTYNEAIGDDFDTFRREAAARNVVGFLEQAATTPLVDYRTPPAKLLDYVRGQQVGERPIAELLEFSEYSSSKLSHYVDDVGRLKRRVATNQTYLDRFDADPLRVEWPPNDADTLWFRTGELVSLVGRFAEESTVSALREIRSQTRSPEYDRLRRAAHSLVKLTDEERERIESGAIEEELSAARESLEIHEGALAEYGS